MSINAKVAPGLTLHPHSSPLPRQSVCGCWALVLRHRPSYHPHGSQVRLLVRQARRLPGPSLTSTLNAPALDQVHILVRRTRAAGEALLEAWRKALVECMPHKPVASLHKGWLEKQGELAGPACSSLVLALAPSPHPRNLTSPSHPHLVLAPSPHAWTTVSFVHRTPQPHPGESAGSAWKSRYFVLLSSRVLVYYESDSSTRQRGEINLQAAVSVGAVPDEAYNYENAIEIVTAKRRWLVCPDARKERDAWLAALRPMIGGNHAAVDAESVDATQRFSGFSLATPPTGRTSRAISVGGRARMPSVVSREQGMCRLPESPHVPPPSSSRAPITPQPTPTQANAAGLKGRTSQVPLCVASSCSSAK